MFWREAPENFANFRRRSQKIEPRAIFLQHLRGFSKKITSRPQKNNLELRGGAFNFNCPVQDSVAAPVYIYNARVAV